MCILDRLQTITFGQQKYIETNIQTDFQQQTKCKNWHLKGNTYQEKNVMWLRQLGTNFNSTLDKRYMFRVNIPDAVSVTDMQQLSLMTPVSNDEKE